MEKLSVIVPTYNESGNVETLVKKIDDALTGIEHDIWFIDDSTDDTPEVLKKLSESNPGVRFEHRSNEKGLATAVLRGFEIADGDFLACMDADLQHPPEVLRPMFAAMRSGADLCIPSRLIPGGSDGGLNPIRKFVSGTARWMGKLALPCLRKISDPTSGLFMFRRRILQDAKLQPVGWKIMVEVLAMTQYRLIVEIPYEFHDRTSGESKLSRKVTLEYIRQLLGLMRRGVKHDAFLVTRWSPEFTEKMVEKYI